MLVWLHFDLWSSSHLKNFVFAYQKRSFNDFCLEYMVFTMGFRPDWQQHCVKGWPAKLQLILQASLVPSYCTELKQRNSTAAAGGLLPGRWQSHAVDHVWAPADFWQLGCLTLFVSCYCCWFMENGVPPVWRSWMDAMNRGSAEHTRGQRFLGQPYVPLDTLHPRVLIVGAVVCAPVRFVTLVNRMFTPSAVHVIKPNLPSAFGKRNKKNKCNE